MATLTCQFLHPCRLLRLQTLGASGRTKGRSGEWQSSHRLYLTGQGVFLLLLLLLKPVVITLFQPESAFSSILQPGSTLQLLNIEERFTRSHRKKVGNTFWAKSLIPFSSWTSTSGVVLYSLRLDLTQFSAPGLAHCLFLLLSRAFPPLSASWGSLPPGLSIPAPLKRPHLPCEELSCTLPMKKPRSRNKMTSLRSEGSWSGGARWSKADACSIMISCLCLGFTKMIKAWPLPLRN